MPDTLTAGLLGAAAVAGGVVALALYCTKLCPVCDHVLTKSVPKCPYCLHDFE